MVGVESSSTDDAEDVVLAHDQVRLIVDLDFCAAVFRNENLVPFLHGEIDFLAVVVDFTGTKSDDFALLRFFLCGIGNNDPALFHFLLFNRLHQHPVPERFYINCCHRFISFCFFWVEPAPFISNGRRQIVFVYFFLSSSTTSNSASTTSPSPGLPAPSSAPGRAPASGPGCGPACAPAADAC